MPLEVDGPMASRHRCDEKKHGNMYNAKNNSLRVVVGFYNRKVNLSVVPREAESNK